ncbi:trifunctional transcriptional regulator/proline dehydrogenase/L-glutamate gamma-semialdehyde dehydrogenase [Ferrovibrio sp.]|uniref:trifunctional transcriptional regulator/proline dehydrogenase/L-glutamate gamma-semialdehyde dehydrogenase n=1 Tax=Ferrovibrio sp. TaxID=1917215 RepID=UPI001B774512|nr:trifunctional transcriptional regulator/proline dehydrogenase/L-glutamate gamma-semialdehyde dehydrogenase [Ferrovibrio sp.]MBP7065008.1 trifunctional transcriptional regulator/proline dehydrogenase/L-glutamate gamma-semialdehyde dehydrogenase [Ferrovibrio sp.]
MAVTTLGVKVDEDLKLRLKKAADRIDRSPHWLIKQAMLTALERIERGETADFLLGGGPGLDVEVQEAGLAEAAPTPFLEFAQSVRPQNVLRARITAAYRRPELECLPLLLSQATLPASRAEAASSLARRLVEKLRRKRQAGGGVEALIHEYSLSSQEGVALMCLAEALLRIPDRATRDALIRDKIGEGDWQGHLGHSPSLFVNAATWGLLITGKLTSTSSDTSLSSALTRLVARGGEPLIRKGVDIAMRMMGEQFVAGRSIAEALANSRTLEAKGFRHSYDMLGEAAMTAADAERYFAAYERAIHSIGKVAARRGIYQGPGISIKLSALHPRYSRAQWDRVQAELLPRLKALAMLARHYDIGMNIDAEEADRLDISLDLLEALCFDADLAGWSGIGFVVQAYQKRAPFVIDYLIDLARRSNRRLMLRLVKGAYWDSEIKRAQIDGLEDFPVYTRKLHTDVSFIACARKMLAAPDAIYPQFATHNARTLATIHAMAGENYYEGQYEFQCLHGMGEPLYEEVVGVGALNRPCRIYAPVGSHESLLPYLVRRLLENGANTSFVNQIYDERIALEQLIADPVELARQIEPLGAPHPKIQLPRAILGTRKLAAGLDLSNEQVLAALAAALLGSLERQYHAAPLLAQNHPMAPATSQPATSQPVRNPALQADLVGHVSEATPEQVSVAVGMAVAEAPVWQATPPEQRAACLLRAADLLENRMPHLLGLIVREAGKSLPNAIAEVREAVDFLRYYAADVAAHFGNHTHRPLGPVACISPWNFPLAIFIGQVAAALAAGNAVLAKPAEETPLIAAEAVRLLREAGLPPGALQLLPGDGGIGAALVADPRIQGVVFTGSTQAARSIQAALAQRLTDAGQPVPLIAETGGLNAMIVDSSALPEQVVADAIASAFDSAGQRCSALRLLCLQEDIADAVLTMLRGAMDQLSVGAPDKLSVDVGPVISVAARRGILNHIEAMRKAGHRVYQAALPASARHGTFVAPTLIEIAAVADVQQEVFGPVLHVLRFRRSEIAALQAAVNASGYGLTFGIHSRIDETITQLAQHSAAGNVYVNRNVIGAVVGVQPFGGHGLSGTGPKAGGPLYLRRLLAQLPASLPVSGKAPAVAQQFHDWLLAAGETALAARCRRYIAHSPYGAALELAGPVGERNQYRLLPRGLIRAVAQSRQGLLLQVAAALASGNRLQAEAAPDVLAVLQQLPEEVRAALKPSAVAAADLVLFEGDGDALRRLALDLAAQPGAIVPVFGIPVLSGEFPSEDYALEWLCAEYCISTNTAAAGGNANLMTIG